MIKSIATSLLALTMSYSALATDNIDGKCETIEFMAEKIMESRQSGVSMTKMMSIEGGGALARTLVMIAYKENRWSTPENQAKAITKFKNKAALECYKANGE